MRNIGCVRTAELIEIPFEMVSGVGARNLVLDERARGKYG